MCTVTVIPRDEGFRLACNRDERRDRPPGVAPSVHVLDGVQATFPLDPRGGGTWIGVNTAGLAAVLLNRTDDSPRPARAGPRFSRGVIVPPLLGSRSVTGALRGARRLNAAAFEPFRLVLVQGATYAVLSSNGAALSVHAGSFTEPLMFTSSSLGDHLVSGPRRILFEQYVLSAANVDARLEGQRRFHEHRWDDRPQMSVLMSRPDARTVSTTVVDVCHAFVTLRYQPIEDRTAARVIAVGRAA
jgi:uncharacterized protein with NRDE domain